MPQDDAFRSGDGDPGPRGGWAVLAGAALVDVLTGAMVSTGLLAAGYVVVVVALPGRAVGRHRAPRRAIPVPAAG